MDLKNKIPSRLLVDLDGRGSSNIYPCDVCIIGRRYNDENNLFSVVCNIFDMSIYYELLDKMRKTNFFDYLIIERYRQQDLF